jgi:hypothetical protein
MAGAGVAGFAGAVAGRRLLPSAHEPGRPVPAVRAGSARRSTTSTTTAPTVPPSTTTTAPAPPTSDVYQLVPGEVMGEAKSVASRVVEALTTHRADEGIDGPVGRALTFASAGLDVQAFTDTAGLVVTPGTSSVGRVVYPQLGGLDPHGAPRRCSVMVVAEQRSGPTTTSRCLDVRLRLEGGSWRVEELADVSGLPVARSAGLSEAAVRALDHDRLVLPDSARWDIHEGRVDDRVLRELVHLADQVPIAVSTFCRGHPHHVFGTGRTSAHMAGRAVDVWAVGEPVVGQRRVDGSPAHSLARRIFEEGRVTNFGSPWAFDGAGGRSFTDPVHDDHFHLGV